MAKKILTVEEYAALVDSLNAKIDTQAKDLEAKAGEIATLKSSNVELTNQVEVLTLAKTTADEQLQQLNAAKNGAGEIIADLKNKLAEANKQVDEAKADEDVVTYNKKQYVSPFKRIQHDGQVYHIKDLKNNPELVKQLIEENLGVLVPKA